MGVRAVPHLPTYEEARRLWETTKPLRGCTPRYFNERPLGLRRDKHIGIRTSDLPGSPVICRLYWTDCVIYHADGTIEINGWPSQSTTTFIDSLVGRHAQPLNNCSAYHIRGGGGVVAGPNIAIRLQGAGRPAEVIKSETFMFYRLNRQKKVAFFKALRWDEFKVWAPAAYDVLGGDMHAWYTSMAEAFPELVRQDGTPRIVSISARDIDHRRENLLPIIRKSITQYNVRFLRDAEEVAHCPTYEDYMRRVAAHNRAS